MSPSKTQSVVNNDTGGGDILWPEKTTRLFQILREYSEDELGKLMNIKGDLLQETYELYSSWTTGNDKIRAIDLYQGVAFEGINYNELNGVQKEYLNKSLLILSAMYGAASPDTLIWSYRLDMTMKPLEETLYSYWKDEISQMFQNEDLVVNLASNEFARMVKLKKGKILNIHFKKGLGKSSKRLSSYEGKKARGEMVGVLAQNKAYTREDIRNLAPQGFVFDQELSDRDNYYYGLSI